MASVVLSPRLSLVRQIGQGAMGEVWIAEDSVLACQVAVKLVAGHLRLDERTLERFQQEARGAARVASPHVVRVLDHGVVEGRPYIVLELLHGEDLGAHLRRVGVLAPAECARIVVQACRGLASVHEARLVHRDVKPDNMFLVDNGGEPFVKLLDFGLAAEVRARVTAATGGSIVGTPSYMSPEHTEGMSAIVPQSDMWSLAVVAYEALTGALPFDGDGLLALAIAIADARFEPPSVHQPLLPPAMDAFFARAFARSPGDRFASATEMAKAFTSAAGLATSATSTAGVATSTAGVATSTAGVATNEANTATASFVAPLVTRKRPRRPIVLAAGAAATVIAVTLGVVSWPREAPPSEAAGASDPSDSSGSAVARGAAPSTAPSRGDKDPPPPVSSTATVTASPAPSLAPVAHDATPARGGADASAAHPPRPLPVASARPRASTSAISLPPGASTADSGSAPLPRRERGF
jgi:eukaryotic-like serine/threonine-protein kinase